MKTANYIQELIHNSNRINENQEKAIVSAQ